MESVESYVDCSIVELEDEVVNDMCVEFEDKIPDGMCLECKEFNIVKDNKCTFCVNGIIKCIKCKEYYCKPNKTYCSECEIVLQYNGLELTIKQVLDLPTSTFKGIQIENHLEEIFNYFKTANGIKNKLIKNINEFKILLNSCKDKSSGEIFCILDGQRDFSSCMLPAKYAVQLLDQSIQNAVTDSYKYIHAIAPFIYDIWNFPGKYSVLDCYYRDFGDLNKCPNDLKYLCQLWGRCIRPMAVSNLNSVYLCDCKCGEPIELHDNKVRCSSCLKYSHKSCADNKCPICHSKLLGNGMTI